MENGIYITLTVVKDGKHYAFQPRLAAEFVPVLLETIFRTGIEGPDAVMEKLGHTEQQI